MKTSTKTLLIGSVILATAGSAAAVAGPGMGGCGPHPAMMQGKGPGMGMGPGMGRGMGMGPGMGSGMGMGHGMGSGMGPGMNHGMGAGQSNMLDRIPNLSDEQREQLTQLQADQRKAMQEFRTKMIAQREANKARLKEILTPEQQAVLPVFQH